MEESDVFTFTPCPDVLCVGGRIKVRNAYSKDPLCDEEQICDRCGGRGYLVTDNFSAHAN